jgi:tetratricopeptide (TPR) repeat protein
MYQQALIGYEKKMGPDHTTTLETVNKLGIIYKDQGKLAKAEQIFDRALAGYRKACGFNDTSSLYIVNNLRSIYRA